jgi:hypothetical protein
MYHSDLNIVSTHKSSQIVYGSKVISGGWSYICGLWGALMSGYGGKRAEEVAKCGEAGAQEGASRRR